MGQKLRGFSKSFALGSHFEQRIAVVGALTPFWADHGAVEKNRERGCGPVLFGSEDVFESREFRMERWIHTKASSEP